MRDMLTVHVVPILFLLFFKVDTNPLTRFHLVLKKMYVKNCVKKGNFLAIIGCIFFTCFETQHRKT